MTSSRKRQLRQKLEESRRSEEEYKRRREHRKRVMVSIVGLFIAVSMILPVAVLSITAATGNDGTSTSSSTASMTKAQRKALLKKNNGLGLTKKQQKEFIETGEITSTLSDDSSPSSSKSQ